MPWMSLLWDNKSLSYLISSHLLLCYLISSPLIWPHCKRAPPCCECVVCQSYPVCVCLPVCLPVCLSAAEGAPLGSASLLLAVLVEELWWGVGGRGGGRQCWPLLPPFFISSTSLYRRIQWFISSRSASWQRRNTVRERRVFSTMSMIQLRSWNKCTCMCYSDPERSKGIFHNLTTSNTFKLLRTLKRSQNLSGTNLRSDKHWYTFYSDFIQWCIDI